MNNTSVIEIFRGDDTDALGYQTIHGIITTDFDLTGCTVVFRYLDFTQSFTDVQSEVPFTITIPHGTTASFPPGFGFASIRVFDSSGKIRTFSNRIPVLVHTSTCCETEGGTFTIDFKMFEQLAPLKIYTVGGSYAEYTGYLQRIIDKATAGQYGLAMLYDGINSDDGASTGMAATPKAVKAALAAAIADATDKYYSKSDVYTKSEVYTKTETDEAIERVAAYYITKNAAGDAFATRTELLGASTYYSGGAVRTPTRNDYAVVLADETHGGAEWRYIYSGSQWEAQYPIETNDYEALSNKPAIDGVTLTKDSTAAGLGLAKTSDLATVATSGSYNDLTNKPTIPAEVTIDDSLSSSSTNPVQNKIVTGALAEKRDFTDRLWVRSNYSMMPPSSGGVFRVANGSEVYILSWDATNNDWRAFESVTGSYVTISGLMYYTLTIPRHEVSESFQYTGEGVSVSVPAGGTTWTVYYASDMLALKSDIQTVDSALSGTSENPVQNKVVKAALSGITAADIVEFLANYKGEWNATDTYSAGDIVHFTESGATGYYKAHLNVPDNNSPTVSPPFWSDGTTSWPYPYDTSTGVGKLLALFSASGTAGQFNALLASLLAKYLPLVLSSDTTIRDQSYVGGMTIGEDLAGIYLRDGEPSTGTTRAQAYLADILSTANGNNSTYALASALANYLPLDGSSAMTGDLSVNGSVTLDASNPTAVELESADAGDTYRVKATFAAQGPQVDYLAYTSDLRYALGSSITASATLADRTANRVVAGASNTTQIALTFPAAVSGKVRDFTVLATRETGDTGGIAFTTPTGATVYGDGFSTAIAEGKTVLYAITEVAENTWYTRAIEMEVAS